MNIGFISLGCAKNQVDSEEIISYLKRNGANMTPNPELADVICINTCAFIEAAKKEAIDTILEMSNGLSRSKIWQGIGRGIAGSKTMDSFWKL